MRTTSQIGVAICILVAFSQAHGLLPRLDFFVEVRNSANKTLEVCNSSLSFCKTLKYGEVFADAQATEGKREKHLEVWLDEGKAKVCGKVVALKNLATLDQTVRERRSIAHTLTITRQAYENECGKS